MKSFYKIHGVYSNNQWNYFQRGCMDKWRSGDFTIQTWCIPLEAFASKITIFITGLNVFFKALNVRF